MKRNPLHNLTKTILATTFALAALLLTPNMTKAEEMPVVQEVESNDTFENINRFDDNVCVNGEISSQEDVDYYLIYVSRPSRFALVPLDAGCGINLYLEYANGKADFTNVTQAMFSEVMNEGYLIIGISCANDTAFTPTQYIFAMDAVKDEETTENVEEIPEEVVQKEAGSVTLSNTKYAYNGKAKKPKVTAKDTEGTVISKDHYTVSYKNNTDIGIGKVIVTFDEEYNNVVIEKNITIKPAKVKIKNLKACYDAIGFTFDLNTDYLDGYQYTISTDANFKKGNKTYTKSMEIDPAASKYKKSSAMDTETELGVLSWNVKHGKTYYIRVRTYANVNGKKIFSEWSSSKKIKVDGLKDTLPVVSYKWYDSALGDDSCIMFYVPIETYDPNDPFKDVREHFWVEDGWFIPNENEMSAIVTSRAKAGTLGDEWAIYRKTKTYSGSRSFAKGWNLNKK